MYLIYMSAKMYILFIKKFIECIFFKCYLMSTKMHLFFNKKVFIECMYFLFLFICLQKCIYFIYLKKFIECICLKCYLMSTKMSFDVIYFNNNFCCC